MATTTLIDEPWQIWQVDSSTSSSSSVWTTWQTNIESSYDSETTPASSSYVWVCWNGEPVETLQDITYQNRMKFPVYKPEKKSVERLRAEGAQKEINRIWNGIIAEEHRLEREAAEVTARQLLLDLVGEDQFKVYEKTGRIFVKGRKYDYLLMRGGGVRRISHNIVEDLCIHLYNRTKYPPTDNVIGLKLMIEGSEAAFNKEANGSRIRSLKEVSWKNAYKEAING